MVHWCNNPRRVAWVFIAMVGWALFALPAARADESAQDTRAKLMVQQAGDQLVRVINGDLPDSQKQAALQPIIDQAVDVDAVARFCLGRAIHTATPQQVSAYLALFRRVLAYNISAKLGEYRGVTFKVLRAAPREDGIIAVSTLITRPNNAPSVVQWLVSVSTGASKIMDLIAEGTSLRLTQRSDYISYLGRHNNDLNVLIEAMRRHLNGG